MATRDPVKPSKTPDLDGAHPRLGEGLLAQLEAHGERRRTTAGEVLYREGDERYDFYVVLKGLVEVVEGYSQDGERTIAVHGPGRFLGELGLLTGQPAFSTAVVRERGQILVVPVDALRALAATAPQIGDVVLRAYLRRRELLIGIGAGLRIVGSRYSPDTRRLREFAARNRLPHRWIDLERDHEAEALLRELGIGPPETPVVIWRGQVLRRPSNAEMARLFHLGRPAAATDVCDLLVVGAGPAGLAASVYGASEGLGTVTLDSVATGGQASTASRIENYLGFPSGISGAELAERATLQAEKFGAHLGVPAEAAALRRDDASYTVTLSDGGEVCARTVVIATGARYRRPDVSRLDEFEGTSVYYAATQVEATVCANDPVVVVGGGNSAGQAALFLAQHTARVRLVIRGGELGADMSRYLVDRIERHAGIGVMLHAEVCELIGCRGVLEAVVVEDNRTSERVRIDAKAMFVFIGAQPCTAWLDDQVAVDDKGFVITGPDVARGDGDARAKRARQPLLLETSLPGVLAVGDVRTGSIKRVASAVGEGAMAIRLVHEHLQDQHAIPRPG